MSTVTRPKRLTEVFTPTKGKEPDRGVSPAPARGQDRFAEAPERAVEASEAAEMRSGRAAEAPDAGEGRAGYYEQSFTQGRSRS